MEIRFPRLLAATLAACALTLLGCGDVQDESVAEVDPTAVASLDPNAQNARPAQVDAARLAAADEEPGQWMGHGRTWSEQRFSPLTAVNRETVDGLGLAWSYGLDSTRGVEATPIVVDGVMYVSAPWSKVHALDARTGKRIWTYDPKVPGERARHACCDVVNRGVAVWKGSVFVGTIDGRLVALDARSGELLWEVQTTDTTKPYSITGAPRVVKDNVIIGNGGAELGVRGYVTAYDTRTGEQVWRFYTVPGDPSKPFEHAELEAAAKTWTGKWWEVGGGGTAWDSMAYDPELDLLYVGTGNGSPWTRYARSPEGGDNLYLCSILALRPDTGELVWHYQVTPGDNWDYTATQHLILADLQIDGATRKVILQAPKNGFFYVLDRETGELISARPYVEVNWASHIDTKTGRPVETPISNYSKKAQFIVPAPQGAHNWHPMAFHPGTGLVYIPARDLQAWYANDPNFSGLLSGQWNLAMDIDRVIDVTIEKPPKPAGFLIAWDPVAQKEVWRVDNASFWNGGVLATAGDLVFAGQADGRFSAFDARTGELAWEARSQTGIIAAPVSYSVDGEQYVAVASGWGGSVVATGRDPEAIITKYHNEGRVLAFKLGGTALMPQNRPRDLTVPAPAPVTASTAELSEGKSLYNRYCMACHGFAAASSLVIPDLRYLTPEKHAAFQGIVRGGALVPRGMPAFSEYLTEAQAELVHQYVNEQAQILYDSEREPAG